MKQTEKEKLRLAIANRQCKCGHRRNRHNGLNRDVRLWVACSVWGCQCSIFEEPRWVENTDEQVKVT